MRYWWCQWHWLQWWYWWHWLFKCYWTSDNIDDTVDIDDTSDIDDTDDIDGAGDIEWVKEVMSVWRDVILWFGRLFPAFSGLGAATASTSTSRYLSLPPDIELSLQISGSSSRYQPLPPDIWLFIQISSSSSRYLALPPSIGLYLQISSNTQMSSSTSRNRALPPDIWLCLMWWMKVDVDIWSSDVHIHFHIFKPDTLSFLKDTKLISSFDFRDSPDIILATCFCVDRRGWLVALGRKLER